MSRQGQTPLIGLPAMPQRLSADDHIPAANIVQRLAPTLELCLTQARFSERFASGITEMLTTDHIQQIATDKASVYAFRVEGGVTLDEMASMGGVMDNAFDLEKTVRMIVILDDFGLSDASAGLALQSIKAQFRSLAHVEKYAIVGAPAFAAAMIELFEKVIPVDARTFTSDDEDAAWHFVGSRPVV